TFVEDNNNDDGNFSTPKWLYTENPQKLDTEGNNIVGRFHNGDSTNLLYTDSHVESTNKPIDEIRKLCAQYK
ncbi:MAG: hypothetical protein IKU29_06185, partial [Parabacteroides sp.]|nr:hypothetical protein [Parabacteroides sp.]